jgi:hypothetical protein
VLSTERPPVFFEVVLYLDYGARMIHPAHGHSFSADVLEKGLSV